jgi:hypothetical protein
VRIVPVGVLLGNISVEDILDGDIVVAIRDYRFIPVLEIVNHESNDRLLSVQMVHTVCENIVYVLTDGS